ncbi:MAG: RagB/SusD family nutrient uptake outer membrane protein, partial [Prevotella sp.]
MKINKIVKLALVGAVCLSAGTSCSTDPTFYSQVVPETFYSSQDAVWQRFDRSFTHWRWYEANNNPRWMMQELGTDEFCLPSRGSDWYDGGKYQKVHHHEYTEDMPYIETGWTNFAMGIALAWDALEDLEKVDFDRLGFPQGTRENMLNQQRTLAAKLYLDGLD